MLSIRFFKSGQPKTQKEKKNIVDDSSTAKERVK